VFSCGTKNDPVKACGLLVKKFAPAWHDMNIIERGEEYTDPCPSQSFALSSPRGEAKANSEDRSGGQEEQQERQGR
jgi:hypothetical protein